jgi:hypothetical protein
MVFVQEANRDITSPSSTSFEHASTRSIQALLTVVFGASGIWLHIATLGLGAVFRIFSQFSNCFFQAECQRQ